MKEIKALGGGVLHIGRTGEHEAVRVVFSLLPFKAAFSGGTPALLVRRAGDDAAYPVPLTVDEDAAYWTVTSADTEKAGFGQCELQWYAGKTLAKSAKLDFLVAQALDGGAEPPDAPSKRWFDGLEGKIGDLSKLGTKEKENLVAAINEAARSGGMGGGRTDMQVADGGEHFRDHPRGRERHHHHAADHRRAVRGHHARLPREEAVRVYIT